MEAFPFLHQILHTRHIDSPVMMWIQICAGEGGVWGHAPLDFFLIKMVQFECSKIRYYRPKKQQF